MFPERPAWRFIENFVVGLLFQIAELTSHGKHLPAFICREIDEYLWERSNFQENQLSKLSPDIVNNQG